VINISSTCLDARILSTGGILSNANITKRGLGTLFIGHPSTFSTSTNYLTGTSSILIEKGNVAFSSLTPIALNTPVTMGNLNSGNDNTVLEVPRANTQDQLVLTPAITLGALAQGATSQAIIRYTGSALGTTSNAAPLVQGSVNLNGRELYLENTSPASGGTSRLWNFAAAVTGTGNVRIRTWANPDGSNSGAGRVRLQSAANAWVGDLYLDRGHVQVGTAAQCIPDNSRIIFSPGTAVTIFNANETVRGLVGGAATEAIPFAATLSVNAGTVLAHVLTLNDSNSANTHVFSGSINNGSPAGSTIALVKSGAATQVFNGVHGYTGATTINGGTLEIGGAGQLGAGTYASNIVIGTGATLKVNSTADQVFQTGVISGAGALVKDNSGTLTLSGVNTFSGDITVNGGTLIGAGSQSGSGGVPVFGSRVNTRTITVNNGATLQFNSGNIVASGYNLTTSPTLVINSGSTVTNGGIATNNALNNVQLNNSTLTSTTGHVGSTSGIPVYGAWNLNGTVTSTGTSTISTTAPDRGWVMLKVSGDTTTNFDVVDGTLTVSAPVVDNPTDGNIGSLRKSGAGTMTLTAVNTYRGDTTVDAGTLVLADDAQLKFILGATSGVNNRITGTGTGTVTLNGDFVIDTSAADALPAGAWTLENVSTLSGAYGSTFSVVGFTDAGNHQWIKELSPTKKYTFDETTGVLILSSAGYSSWASINGAGPNLDDDHDNDGVPNGVEYFLVGPGGNSTGFTAVPGVSKDPGTGALSVTWAKGAGYAGVLNLDFVVETSSTLTGPWTIETQPGNVVDSPASVIFTFPAGPPYTGKRFARIGVSGP
jgi:autotransporter-associated beta strand protein